MDSSVIALQNGYNGAALILNEALKWSKKGVEARNTCALRVYRRPLENGKIGEYANKGEQ
jgi:hypothetical protein